MPTVVIAQAAPAVAASGDPIVPVNSPASGIADVCPDTTPPTPATGTMGNWTVTTTNRCGHGAGSSWIQPRGNLFYVWNDVTVPQDETVTASTSIAVSPNNCYKITFNAWQGQGCNRPNRTAASAQAFSINGTRQLVLLSQAGYNPYGTPANGKLYTSLTSTPYSFCVNSGSSSALAVEFSYTHESYANASARRGVNVDCGDDSYDSNFAITRITGTCSC